MHKLIVTLPVNRDFEGMLRLEDQNGRLVAGPFAVCGRADGEAAGRHGNSSRHTLLPFGDTPLGRYRIAGILPTGRRTNLSGERFGPYGVVLLKPTAGDAALADANGRFHTAIHGGKLGLGRRLRPTNGSLRLADKDQRRLVRALRKGQSCLCDCVTTAEPVTGRTVARGPSYEESDPPLGGSLVSLPVAAATSGSLGADGFLYEGDQPRRFGPPSFHLFADSGGGGGGGSAGGGTGGGGYDGPRQQPLIEAQNAAMNDPALKPGAGGEASHCNEATYAVAAAMGAPTGPLVDKKGDALSASEQAANLAMASSPYRQVSASDAQQLANEGKLVIVAYSNPDPDGHGHVATVRPQGLEGDTLLNPESSRGPLINNIGESTGVTGQNWVFTKNMKVYYYTPR
jgi:hypothetical protein